MASKRYIPLPRAIQSIIRGGCIMLFKGYEVNYPPLVWLAKKMNKPPHVLSNALFLSLGILLVLNPWYIAPRLSDIVIFVPLFISSLESLAGQSVGVRHEGRGKGWGKYLDLWIVFSGLHLLESCIGRKVISQNISWYWVFKLGILGWIYTSYKGGEGWVERGKRPVPLKLKSSNIPIETVGIPTTKTNGIEDQDVGSKPGRDAGKFVHRSRVDEADQINGNVVKSEHHDNQIKNALFGDMRKQTVDMKSTDNQSETQSHQRRVSWNDRKGEAEPPAIDEKNNAKTHSSDPFVDSSRTYDSDGSDDKSDSTLSFSPYSVRSDSNTGSTSSTLSSNRESPFVLDSDMDVFQGQEIHTSSLASPIRPDVPLPGGHKVEGLNNGSLR